MGDGETAALDQGGAESGWAERDARERIGRIEQELKGKDEDVDTTLVLHDLKQLDAALLVWADEESKVKAQALRKELMDRFGE